jgi:hypothetical protein
MIPHVVDDLLRGIRLEAALLAQRLDAGGFEPAPQLLVFGSFLAVPLQEKSRRTLTPAHSCLPLVALATRQQPVVEVADAIPDVDDLNSQLVAVVVGVSIGRYRVPDDLVWMRRATGSQQEQQDEQRSHP